MKCPHCNMELPRDDLKFCSFCGEKITGTADVKPEPIVSKPRQSETKDTELDLKQTTKKIKDSIQNGISEVKKSYNTEYSLPQNITPDKIHPCFEEKPVKQYTFMKMFLPIAGYRASGLLQVTNKRVIYESIGSSIMGKEYSHSEVAIDDIAGISVEKSSSLNILLMIVFFLLSLPLGLFGGSFGFLFAFIHPFLVLVAAIGCMVGLCVLMKKKHYVWMHVLAVIGGVLCLSGIAGVWAKAQIMSTGSGLFIVGLLTLMIFFKILNIVSYAFNLFKTNVSVVVSSKSGGATPINCSASKNWLVGISMLKPLVYMEETTDTAIMEAELGAMISDIQKMSDYGLEKWINN